MKINQDMFNECIETVHRKVKVFYKELQYIESALARSWLIELNELDIIESLTEPEPRVRRTLRLVTCHQDGVNTP